MKLKSFFIYSSVALTFLALSQKGWTEQPIPGCVPENIPNAVQQQTCVKLCGGSAAFPGSLGDNRCPHPYSERPCLCSPNS